MTDKEMQGKILEMQTLSEQIKNVQEQVLVLEQQIIELSGVEDGLKEVKKAKQGEEIFVSLGSGIFVKAELKDTEKILMNVGNKTLVKKPISEAKKLVANQVKEIKDVMEHLNNEVKKGIVRLQDLQKELEKLNK